MANGGSVLGFCRQDNTPSRWAFYRWAAKDPEFAQQFDRARECRGDILGEEAHEIAEQATPEMVQVAKLRVDTKLRLAAVYDRNRFGQNAKIEHSGKVALEALVVGSLEVTKPAEPLQDEGT